MLHTHALWVSKYVGMATGPGSAGCNSFRVEISARMPVYCGLMRVLLIVPHTSLESHELGPLRVEGASP